MTTTTTRSGSTGAVCTIGRPKAVAPGGGFRPPGASGEVFDELLATGAVVVGRRTFDLVDGWGGDHHGVPIFVLTRNKPEADTIRWPLVTYVTDVQAAMASPWWVPGSHRLASEASMCMARGDSPGSWLRARAARWLRRS